MAGLVRDLQGKLSEISVGPVTAADAATVLGVLFAAWLALKVVFGIIGFLLTPAKRKLSSYGKWAIVTGATDGIGKAYAKELATRGLDIVIIARNPDKLREVATSLSTETGRKIETIVADFSKQTGDFYGRIDAEIVSKTSGGTIGILVNNVGVSYPSTLYTHELEGRAPGLTDQLIALNITATVKMTQLVLPGMLSAGKGAIVNIASAAGRIPVGNPLLSIYSGTKAFVDFFSRSMHAEYAERGIVVQCQSPYLVATAMSKIRGASLFTPSPASFAYEAAGAIGPGEASVVPYGPHALQDWFFRAIPRWLAARILLSLHKDIRKRYLKKIEGAAAKAAASAAATVDAAASVPETAAAPAPASRGGKKKQ